MRSGVDNGAIAAQPLARADVFWPAVGVGEVQVGASVGGVRQVPLHQLSCERGTKLATGTDHQNRRGRQWLNGCEQRVVAVFLGQFRLVQRNGPIDGQLGIREVHKTVGRLRVSGPVVGHQVGVGGGVLEGLERVAHPSWHEHGGGGHDLVRDHGAEAGTAAQVHPRAENGPGGHGDVFVPRLGVDAARSATGAVEGDVVLHGNEVRKPRLDRFGALPVLLEPTAIVPWAREVDDQQTVDRRGVDLDLRSAH